jgi:hypothetical protein
MVREVIVVDNASTDGSPDRVAEQFTEVILIRSSENLGFARANNLGIRHASGSLVALINSDVIVHPECFQHLAAVFQTNPRSGLAGPMVLGRDGRLQFTCGRLPTVWNTACEFLLLHKLLPGSTLFSGFQERQRPLDRRAEVEMLSGCFWLARRSAVEQVGGLDEHFFFYAEDIDWCKRFRDAGWKIVFEPKAVATHFGGGSSSNAPLRFSIEVLRANLFYWQKHYGYFGRSMYWSLAIIQHGLRLAARGFLRLTGLGHGDETQGKLQEHIVCLRWLMTGKGV